MSVHLVFALVDKEHQVWECTAPSGRVYQMSPTVGRWRCWYVSINKRMQIKPRFDLQADAIRFCQGEEAKHLSAAPLPAAV